jgi:hypothetical protein
VHRPVGQQGKYRGPDIALAGSAATAAPVSTRAAERTELAREARAGWEPRWHGRYRTGSGDPWVEVTAERVLGELAPVPPPAVLMAVTVEVASHRCLHRWIEPSDVRNDISETYRDATLTIVV